MSLIRAAVFVAVPSLFGIRCLILAPGGVMISVSR